VALLPFLASGLQVAHLLGLSHVTGVTIAAPLSVLLGCVWYLVWVSHLSAHLDDEFVVGLRADRRRWDTETRRYFTGYLRRMGIQVNERLLKRALFLPGKVDTVLSYGGGLALPRIVINEGLLRLALGPLPPEDRMQAGEGAFADWMTGTLRPKRRAKKEWDDPEEEEGWNARDLLAKWGFARKAAEPDTLRAQAARPFNLHNATVLGYVLPEQKERTEALAADNREDFRALGELLTAHYAQFSKEEEEDQELDDSDPTDRDFLFGALLREQGILELRHQFLGTFSIAVVHACRHVPMRFAWTLGLFRDLYAATFSKYPDMLADAYAALNSGRNHLTQALFHQLTGQERMLTVRADETALYVTSRAILAEVTEIPPTAEDLPLRSTLRNRLMWLSEFFYRPMPDPSSPWMRQLTWGSILIVTLIVAQHFVTETLLYREVYAARMAETRRRIEEQNDPAYKARLAERKRRAAMPFVGPPAPAAAVPPVTFQPTAPENKIGDPKQ
ncbi:MAG TPA: hypothetical protein VM598_00880, partial [Bdellovibrionota bacterium]|nr:hypothetical protein [Bdellovibrionota bacterium]